MKKIGILVFAAALVVAMTGGIVYAKVISPDASYAYGPYNLATSYDSYGSTSMDPNQPSGNVDENTGDTVLWGNVLTNKITRDVTGYIQDYTMPGNGLNAPYSTSMTVKAGQSTGTIPFSNTVADGSHSYTIYASHCYQDGNNYYGPGSCTSMKFY